MIPIPNQEYAEKTQTGMQTPQVGLEPGAGLWTRGFVSRALY